MLTKQLFIKLLNAIRPAKLDSSKLHVKLAPLRSFRCHKFLSYLAGPAKTSRRKGGKSKSRPGFSNFTQPWLRNERASPRDEKGASWVLQKTTRRGVRSWRPCIILGASCLHSPVKILQFWNCKCCYFSDLRVSADRKRPPCGQTNKTF